MGNTRLYRGFLSPFRREHLAGASQRKSATIPVVAKEKKYRWLFLLLHMWENLFLALLPLRAGGDEKGAVIFLMSSVSWLVKMVPSFSFPLPRPNQARIFFQKVLFSTVGKARDGAKK